MNTYTDDMVSESQHSGAETEEPPGGYVVTVVMPCLNEAESLAPCIEKAKAAIEAAGRAGRGADRR